MPSLASTNDALIRHYTTAIDALREIANSYFFLGRLGDALRALSFREAGGFRPYQPFDHLSLWDIYLKKGDTTSAQFHMQQASTLASEMGLSTLVSSVINTTNRLQTQQEEA